MTTSPTPAGALADIAHLLESAENPQVRVQCVLELVHVLLACDRCAIANIHGGEVPELSTLPEAAALDVELRSKIDRLLAVVSDKLNGYGERAPITGTGDGGNHLAVPLIAADRVSGLLLVERDRSAFGEHDLQVLVVVGAQLGAYLANLRLRAEEARATTDRLKVLEEWRRTFDSVPDLIAVVDDQYRVKRVNRAMAERLGRNPRDCVGLRCYEAIHGLEAPPPFCPHTKTLADGQEHAFELHEERLGGDFIMTTTPLVGPDGRLAGAVHVARDITERKRAEKALSVANAQLLETDQRKNDFLAALSHELRNPLAPITNSLYLLDHAPPGGEQASRAREVIARQVMQLTNLVNDLLDVTRITRNKVLLHRERLELNAAARRALEDSRFLFERAGVRLDLEPAPRPVHVIADRTRVAQIICNLLQNAAKFTRRGGRTLVSVHAEGGEATVRVADDGVGMTPETLARLFQPFMQAPQTLDRSAGGLGLGLALVRGLVELHGGSISARSEGLGKGADFLVRLPLDSGVALEPEETPAAPAQARRRVLIIEDNADAADSLRDVLRLDEHEVEVAYSGPEGIARARTFKPEIVLCDIGLPGMDGYEVARTLRKDTALAGAHLVALSGYALADDLQRAAAAGFERHLAKPPDLKSLERMFAELAPVTVRAGDGLPQQRITVDEDR